MRMILSDRASAVRDYIMQHYTLLQFFREHDLAMGNIKGEEATVCCLFHDEKTPSMGLNLSTNQWKCQGCGLGGGIIKLWMYWLNKTEDAKFNYTKTLQYLITKDREMQRALGFSSLYMKQHELFANYKDIDGNFTVEAIKPRKPHVVTLDSHELIVKKLKGGDIQTILDYISDCEREMPDTQIYAKYLHGGLELEKEAISSVDVEELAQIGHLFDAVDKGAG